MKIEIPFTWKDIIIGMIMGVSLIGNLFLYNRVWMCEQSQNDILTTDCDITFAQFYYHPQCGWCERQLNEGGLEQLEEYGVSIQKIDVSKANYEFIEGTPAWDINGEISYGYKTIDQLKDFFGC